MFFPKFLFAVFVILLAGPFYVNANSASAEFKNITVEQAIEKALNNNLTICFIA